MKQEELELNHKKLKLYSQELDRIKQEHNGMLNTSDVVEEAKSKSNPLHDVFEWDDTKASHQYRLYQARALIGKITYIVTINNQKIHQRKYFNVTIGKGYGGKTYVDLPTVLSNERFKEEVVEKAIREVESWKEKYIQYQKLGMIFKAIDKTKKKVLIRARRKNVNN